MELQGATMRHVTGIWSTEFWFTALVVLTVGLLLIPDPILLSWLGR
jgi:hypothetical protein